MDKVLGVIGCGKMAYALLKGVVNDSSSNFGTIYCNDINDERTSLFTREFKAIAADQKELVEKSDVIIMAVKPQQVRQVLAAAKGLWDSGKLLISIAAGVKTIDIEKEIEARLPVVRVMPNTPCLVAEGVSAIAAGKYALSIHTEMVLGMLNSLGMAVSIDEKYMDAITAVSGSGPAYVFLVAESMINAAVEIGLDHSLARSLVLNTIKGSIKLMEETGEHPAILRDQVSSPGGTTIAGVRKLEENGLRKAFFDAVEEAFLKSIELGRTR